MNFLLRKLFRHIPPEKEARFLTEIVSGSAYQVFLDEYFRQLIKFDRQIKVEQDRIFNELVVTGLLLLISAIKDNLSKIELARQMFWQNVLEFSSKSYVEWLGELGIEKEYLEIWEKLIDLRLKEYQERQTLTRGVWAEEFFNHREDEQFNDAMVRLETLTVSSMLHITRGRAKRNDPLRRHLRTWLSVLNNKLESRVGW